MFDDSVLRAPPAKVTAQPKKMIPKSSSFPKLPAHISDNTPTQKTTEEIHDRKKIQHFEETSIPQETGSIFSD